MSLSDFSLEVCEDIAERIIQARTPLVPNSSELLEEMHVPTIHCVAGIEFPSTS